MTPHEVKTLTEAELKAEIASINGRMAEVVPGGILLVSDRELKTIVDNNIQFPKRRGRNDETIVARINEARPVLVRAFLDAGGTISTKLRGRPKGSKNKPKPQSPK
jgi:hypothetical protein